MKQRVVLVLVLVGVAAVGLAIWLYQDASRDRDIEQSICRMGGGICDVSMNWTPTLLAGALAIAAFVAAWFVNRSGQTESAENLVG